MPGEEQLSCTQCGQNLSINARFCDRCGTPTPAGPGLGDVDTEGLQPIRAGDVLDAKWRIESKLGAGGMGSVFLAHDLQLDRKVAVKALAPALCSDSEFVARFEREARMTARLEHPNIVPVYSVGRHFGRPFIVMKKLSGRSLSALLRDHVTKSAHFGPEEVLGLLRQLCAGLSFIHEKGFVHRDLKPGNIFVGADGHLTILDFGILRDPKSGLSLTRAGNPLGTPHYMAPEQATVAKDADLRADLYSVGIILFEILALSPPFDADTSLAILRMHAMAPPPDVRSMSSRVPQDVALAIKKALAKKPADRFQSAQELYSAIEAGYRDAGARASLPMASAPRVEEPHVPVAPLLDEPPPPASLIDESSTGSVDDTLTRPREEQLKSAAASQEDRPIQLSPMRTSKRIPRMTPAPGPAAPMPDTSEDESVMRKQQRLAERSHRIQVLLFVLVVLAVLGVLAWSLSSALWPNVAVKDEAEVPAVVPKPTPAIARPQPKPKVVVDPGAPLDDIAPPKVELAPPPVDFKPDDPLAPDKKPAPK